MKCGSSLSAVAWLYLLLKLLPCNSSQGLYLSGAIVVGANGIEARQLLLRHDILFFRVIYFAYAPRKLARIFDQLVPKLVKRDLTVMCALESFYLTFYAFNIRSGHNRTVFSPK